MTSATFDVYGAQGGSGDSTGGNGAHVNANLSGLTAGQVLEVTVGGAGAGCAGGFNGGGDALCEQPAGGGGGASDVRTGAFTLSDRVLVAGGGGGGARAGGAGGDSGNPGGSGGSAAVACSSASPISPCWGTGGAAGTATAGGAGGFPNGGNGGTPTQDQGGVGGAPANNTTFGGGGGGGGGGFYGGGGGGGGFGETIFDGGNGAEVSTGGGGGGGSSLTGGGTATDGVQTGNGLVTITYTAPNTITVTNPGPQTSTVESALGLQMSGADSASSQTLTYSASGLPAGLSISSTGLISGTPTTVGTSSVTVTATDSTGASGSASFSWMVIYNWSGFFSPISTTQVNVARAGQSIPVQFSLGGNQGLPIFAAGYPRTVGASCTGWSALSDDTISPTDTAGGSGLQYDPTSNTYTYVWKTAKSWSGTCRQLQVGLNDGTMPYTADFEFK